MKVLGFFVGEAFGGDFSKIEVGDCFWSSFFRVHFLRLRSNFFTFSISSSF